VTDGRGWEAEASIREFTKDDTAILDVLEITKRTEVKANKILLRVMPVLLQKGKNDYLMEKAQELGVDELWPVTSDRCEVKIPSEKIAKTVDRWRKIAVEASKQSGCLTMVRISEPRPFRDAVEALGDGEGLVIFHPGEESVPFAKWLGELRGLEGKIKAVNILIGPEGGFTEDEIEWVKWRGKKKHTWFVGLGEVLFKADTAFVGIVAALRFSGILSD
jgi:16S rRNA (uracil1498-N3)-methyltransferase